jgi:hypothetical protein
LERHDQPLAIGKLALALMQLDEPSIDEIGLCGVSRARRRGLVPRDLCLTGGRLCVEPVRVASRRDLDGG